MNQIRPVDGEYGADRVTTTAAQTGTWYAIMGMWSVTVFGTLTELGGSLTGTTGSMVLLGNQVIYGAFTNFTLTSGAVRCYRTRNTTANP